MNANDTAQKIFLSSYNEAARNYFTFDLKNGSVERVKFKSLPEAASQSNGLGEFVRLHRFKKEERFIALFVLNKQICFAIGREWFAIGDQATVKLISLSRSFLSGRQKTFELHRGAKDISSITYYQCESDRWEDDDGDIFWWIERELQTPESRKSFLERWPRNVRGD